MPFEGSPSKKALVKEAFFREALGPRPETLDPTWRFMGSYKWSYK